MAAQREWGVAIVHRKTNEVSRTVPAWNMDDALRIQRGVEINLNRRDYRTQIVFPAKQTEVTA